MCISIGTISTKYHLLCFLILQKNGVLIFLLGSELKLNTGKKISVLLLALVIQICIAGLIFVGGLLDPLIGLWVVGIYFFIIGTYLTYRHLLTCFSRTACFANDFRLRAITTRQKEFL